MSGPAWCWIVMRVFPEMELGWPGPECGAGTNWDGDGLELSGAGTKDKQN